MAGSKESEAGIGSGALWGITTGGGKNGDRGLQVQKAKSVAEENYDIAGKLQERIKELEATVQKKMEEEAAAKKKADEEAAATRKKKEEDAARKVEEAKKKEEEDAAAKKKAEEEEAAAKKKKEEEEAKEALELMQK